MLSNWIVINSLYLINRETFGFGEKMNTKPVSPLPLLDNTR